MQVIFNTKGPAVEGEECNHIYKFKLQLSTHRRHSMPYDEAKVGFNLTH